MNIEIVKILRDKTNVSLDACKKALEQSNGNIDEAIIFLQKRGELKASQMSDRPTNEGRIHSYVHFGRIGVMVEILCQTDFCSKSKEFIEFCDAVSMQIASMNPQYISDLSEGERDKQIDIFKAQLKKAPPEAALTRMIDGKLASLQAELCLLHQESVVVPDKTIEQLRVELVAKIGENVSIKRFVRWEVGVA